VADLTPGPEETPELQGIYTVDDYINLDLTIYRAMHIGESSVVFSHEDDARRADLDHPVAAS
jgi:hypothetical protein